MTSLDLTKEQRKVLLHGCKDGRVKPTKPLLVLAGAGTGKTRTLAAFAAHRIANGTDPARILLLAFGNKAAAEMEQRLANMIGAKGNHRDGGLTQCGTFHATGLHFIRRYADRLGLSRDFTVRRYSIMALLGLVTDDDDRQSASITLEDRLRDIFEAGSIDDLKTAEGDGLG